MEVNDNSLATAGVQLLVAIGCFVVAYVYWRKREWVKGFTRRAVGDSQLVKSTTEMNVRVMPIIVAVFGLGWLILAVTTLLAR